MRGKRPCAKRNLSVWTTRGLAELDQRLMEAREEKRIISELTAHVGGDPTAPQRLLIKRIARMAVMVSLLEQRVLERADFTDLAMRQLVALSNSVRLGVAALGLERPEVQAPSLTKYIGGKAA